MHLGNIWSVGFSASMTNTIDANNIGEAGPDCSGSVSSGGHNLVGNS